MNCIDIIEFVQLFMSSLPINIFSVNNFVKNPSESPQISQHLHFNAYPIKYVSIRCDKRAVFRLLIPKQDKSWNFDIGNLEQTFLSYCI